MKRSTCLAALAAAAGGLLSAPALAQFTNADFETGDLTGWTVTPTFNGITVVQIAEQVDIDGPGILGTTFGGKFRVGHNLVETAFQGGIELSQTLNLTAGTGYLFAADWAALNTGGSNAEGGVFQWFVESRRLGAAQAAGSTSSTLSHYGHIEAGFSPETSGPYRVGLRITRPFTTGTSTLNQFVDNFALSTGATVGACCLPDGSCFTTRTAECTAAGGTYAGDGITCGAAACVQPGSCCVTDSGCFIRSSAQCAALSGVYGGNGTTCASAGCANAAFAFGPLANRATDGGSSINIPILQSASHTIQLCMAASELGGVTPGSTLTGMAFRQDNAAANTLWPAGDTTFTQYDIEVSTGGATPGQMSPLFASNTGPSPVVVRSGALTIPAGSFPGGAVAPAVNGWGFVIPFDTPFTYSGGALLVTIRKSTSNAPDNRNLDAIANNAAAYFNTVQALQATSTTATQGNTMAFPVVRFTVAGGGPAPCYPNCDGSTTAPILNVQDFGCFLNKFAAGDTYANCDGSTTAPILNVQDFACFLNSFAVGCS